MASDESVIKVRGVRFGYTPKTPVIESVDAVLKPGRVTALVGPNAAGKTTLMRLMLGLLRPWSGEALMDNHPIHAMDPKARARELSYVPQSPGVRFAFTVRQVIAMGGHALRGPQDEAIDRVIADAELERLAGRVFAELSGGQQQRVLLARAELQASKGGRAMLLDEPSSHLDLRYRHALMQRLRELAQTGLAVLVVLHELDLAARYADEAWLMDQGRLVASGPWQDVLTPESLEPVYGLSLQSIRDENGGRPILVARHDSGDTMPAVTVDPGKPA